MEGIQCTLCGSKKIAYIPNKIRNDEEGKFKMYRCASCETHFLYPMPSLQMLEQYYDGEFRAEVHSEHYYDKESMDRIFRGFTPEAKERVERVKKQLNKEDEILEIGCSVGYFLDSISSYVKHAYGTEWDKKAQVYIQDELGKKNIEAKQNPEDFGKQFDKIFMFHVLEHIENPVTYLQQLKNFLKPNGKIYIEVPNVDDVMVKTYECDAFKDFYYKKAHLYNFNEKGLSYIFGKSGFQYKIDFIERYDLSNHLCWLGKGVRGGYRMYAEILGDAVNEAYVEALKRHKQTDTLFAELWV